MTDQILLIPPLVFPVHVYAAYVLPYDFSSNAWNVFWFVYH